MQSMAPGRRPAVAASRLGMFEDRHYRPRVPNHSSHQEHACERCPTSGSRATAQAQLLPHREVLRLPNAAGPARRRRAGLQARCARQGQLAAFVNHAFASCYPTESCEAMSQFPCCMTGLLHVHASKDSSRTACSHFARLASCIESSTIRCVTLATIMSQHTC